MAKEDATVAEAITHGDTTPLTRLWSGLKNLDAPGLKSIVVGTVKNRIPVGYVLVKAAWESNGIPTTQSKTHKDVGLYQFQIPEPDGDKEIAGKVYSYKSLMDPKISTEAFVAWTRSVLKSKDDPWFPEGDGWQKWKTTFLMAAIGPGATRTLMEAVGPGMGTFDRIVAFTRAQTNTGWFEKHEKDWGTQSPTKVVFRVILADRLMKEAEKISPAGMAGLAASPFGLGTVAALAIGIGAVAVIVRRRRQGRREGATAELAGTTPGGTSRDASRGVCVGPMKHANVPDSRFDPVQLLRGIHVELEHTDSRACAKAIAKAHLMESPRYYELLEEMERKMKGLDAFGGMFDEGLGQLPRGTILPPEPPPWVEEYVVRKRPPRPPKRGQAEVSRPALIPRAPHMGEFGFMFGDAVDDRIEAASYQELQQLRSDLLGVIKSGQHQMEIGGERVLVPVVLGKVNARLKGFEPYGNIDVDYSHTGNVRRYQRLMLEWDSALRHKDYDKAKRISHQMEMIYAVMDREEKMAIAQVH